MSIQISYLTPLIQVFDMSRSLKFYRDILGFTVNMDSGNADDSSWVWITKDGTHLMLNDQYEPGCGPAAPPNERVKWHKDTCLFLGCDDLEGVYKYLKAKGLDLQPPSVTSYGMKQLSLTDPDGYHLCFQSTA
ncbi:MAG TPA: glyoxalase superfamily protein [Pyrinomonadaceae bacterium]|nr:glyoxalase superfamily protein [Pyrinomonadaceae bacterium]